MNSTNGDINDTSSGFLDPFLSLKHFVCSNAPEDLRRNPTSAPSSILRCLLSRPPEKPSAASLSAPQPAGSAQSRVRRGLRKDPLTGRLSKLAGQRHWSEQTYAAMTEAGWSVFRTEVGIEVELVQRRVPGTDVTCWTGTHPVPPMRCWAEGAVLPPGLVAAASERFQFPTAIQCQCIPALAHRTGSVKCDLVAVAETGGGKTFAYILPALEEVLVHCPRLLGNDNLIALGPFVLVVVPTRELAEQVCVETQQIAQQAAEKGIDTLASSGQQPALGCDRNTPREVRVIKVVGEESEDRLHDELSRGAHIVVGTVGQLHALLDRRLLSLGNTRMVVADEADRLAEGSHRELLDAVLSRVPRPHQTAFFTATKSVPLEAMARQHLSPEGYYCVRCPNRCVTVLQSFEVVPDQVPASTDGVRPLSTLHPQKLARLVTLLLYGDPPMIVFVNEKATCDALFCALQSEAERLRSYAESELRIAAGAAPNCLSFLDAETHSAPRRQPCVDHLAYAAAVHAGMSQQERERLVGCFQRRERHVLLTTDLLARGLDVPGVSLVINYDLPRTRHQSGSEALTQYIHRIGRTGRAGRRGVAVSLVCLPAGGGAAPLPGEAEAEAASGESSDSEPCVEPSPQRRRGETREEQKEQRFEDDTALAPFLWKFLVEVVDSNGVRQPERVLRGNAFPRIDIPAELALVASGGEGGGRQKTQPREWNYCFPLYDCFFRTMKHRSVPPTPLHLEVETRVDFFLPLFCHCKPFERTVIHRRKGLLSARKQIGAATSHLLQLTRTTKCSHLSAVRRSAVEVEREMEALTPVAGLDGRAAAVLQRSVACAESRERLLSEVRRVSVGDTTPQRAIQRVRSLHSQVTAAVAAVGQAAKAVGSFAAETEAEAAATQRLQELLARVGAAQRIAGSLLRMDVSTREIQGAVTAGDVERTVELITAYDAAKASALGGSADAVETRLGPSLSSDGVVRDARAKCSSALRERAAEAKAKNDKEGLIWATRLMQQLNDGAAAAAIYSDWVCETSLAPARQHVAAELAKMDTPQAAQSHLVLVSQLLDAVAATYESEGEFVRHTFGESNARALLQRLHEEATRECVPVLHDFIRRRNDVASLLEASLRRRETDKNNLTSPPPSDSSSAMAALASVARRADQVLEEISHIASCTHVYFTFVQRQLEGEGEGQEPSKASNDSVDHLWASQESQLLVSVQEALSLYCPIQQSYLRVAFAQATRLQESSVEEKESLSAAAADPKSRVDASSESALLQRVNTSNADVAASERDRLARRERAYYQYPGIITLPDDVFYVLRMAVHRAFHTKSTQVISAALMCISDALRDTLITELANRVGLGRRSSVPPSVLRWVAAAHKSVSYTRKLSEELLRLAVANYCGTVLERLKEQASDIDACAKELESRVNTWLEQCAVVLFRDASSGHLEKLADMDYKLSEDTLYFYELNDPWAHGFIQTFGEVAEDVKRVLDAATFDQLLLHLGRITVKSLRQQLSKKTFNAFGALQIDKDIRAICYLLTNLAEEVSLRQVCGPLTLTASLLLVDRPRDALDEAHNTALTSDEKRSVLLQRVDLDAEEVRLLKL
eukprot:gene8469-5945_t